MLMLLIIEAKVVDLPEPVGPVTNTSPLGFSEISRTMLGKFRVCILGIFDASARKQAAYVPRSL